MKFNGDFDILQRIELLERSILVCSLAYYELNDNLLSDSQYDYNTRQLLELKSLYPADFAASRYFEYFKNFESGTGFYLAGAVKEKDSDLYERIKGDAFIALEFKRRISND